MSKKPLLDFLEQILSGSVEQTKLEAMNIINEGVDKDLMHQMLKCGDGHKTGTIFSTLAYALVHELYTNTTTEQELCFVSQTYADFIHQAGHALWGEHGDPHKKPVGDSTH